MFSSPQNAFCFTNLSRLDLEIFRFFEKHAQNLNTLQNNSASWALQMGFNLAFKGLISVELLAWLTHEFLKNYSNLASLRVSSEIYFILLKIWVGNSVMSASLT